MTTYLTKVVSLLQQTSPVWVNVQQVSKMIQTIVVSMLLVADFYAGLLTETWRDLEHCLGRSSRL